MGRGVRVAKGGVGAKKEERSEAERVERSSSWWKEVSFEVGKEEIKSGCRTKGEGEGLSDLGSRVGERATADLSFDCRNGK